MKKGWVVNGRKGRRGRKEGGGRKVRRGRKGGRDRGRRERRKKRSDTSFATYNEDGKAITMGRKFDPGKI